MEAVRLSDTPVGPLGPGWPDEFTFRLLGCEAPRLGGRGHNRWTADIPANVNAKTLPTQQSVNAAVKQICDIMRRSNCAGALQYVPELTWILFLRVHDECEEIADDEARAVGRGLFGRMYR